MKLPDVNLSKTLALRDTASPKLWMDAWLAALAMGANLQLVTFDRGFTQFDGLNLLLLDPSP
jgi:predicted nucleic acid-binding protein